ncbi:MAG: DoxX family protein [Bacteroidia bacterium]
METTSNIKKPKALNITLWIAQSILAVLFLMTGVIKFTTSIEAQQSQMEWAKHVSGGLIYFVAIVEIFGAIGLLLPSILKIKPQLTPWAAIGLALVMVLALFLNVAIGETKAIGTLTIIIAIALFVAWGRFKKVPIQSKN